ncbi:MAG: hypothetical protein GY951_16190, partial [Psychromonas sp.]|nr:hypothetical protein [Psychromonas sp.]
MFGIFDSHIVNMKIIDKLTTLKISTSELIYASHYYPHDMAHIIQEIDTQLPVSQLFESSWFNTHQINKSNQQLSLQWEDIHRSIEQRRFTETEQLLKPFVTSLTDLVKQYQILANKKMHLVHIAELVSFFMIMLIAITLYLYSKKQIV